MNKIFKGSDPADRAALHILLLMGIYIEYKNPKDAKWRLSTKMTREATQPWPGKMAEYRIKP